MEMTDYLIIAGVVMLGLMLLLQAFMAYVLTFAIRRMQDLDEHEQEMTRLFNEQLGQFIWAALRIGQMIALFAFLFFVLQVIEWL